MKPKHFSVMILITLLIISLLFGCSSTEPNGQSAIERLKAGNQVFLQSNDSRISKERRMETAQSQSPYAVILTCSDSRVSPELIFSAGIGDLFVVRTAGNVVGDFELGSVEYGAVELGAELILVLGHTDCGAVKAAIEGHAEGHIEDIVIEIRKAIGSEQNLNKAVVMNANYSAKKITRSKLIANLLSESDLTIKTGIYDLKSGKVAFLDE